MSTTAAKGEAFVRMVGQIAYHVREAHKMAQQGAELRSALDMAAWLLDAPIDENGDLVDLGVSPAEVNAASASIAELISFLEGGTPAVGDHLGNLLRCLDPAHFTN